MFFKLQIVKKWSPRGDDIKYRFPVDFGIEKMSYFHWPGNTKMRLPLWRGAIFDINRGSKLESEKRSSGGGFWEAFLVSKGGPTTKCERKVEFQEAHE